MTRMLLSCGYIDGEQDRAGQRGKEGNGWQVASEGRRNMTKPASLPVSS